MTKRMGFIGVGLMGHGMAKNLVEKAPSVNTVSDRQLISSGSSFEKLASYSRAKAVSARGAREAYPPGRS